MPEDPKDPTPAAAAKPAYTISKKKDTRWWEVRDPENALVCLTVYPEGRARGGAAARGVRGGQW